MQKKLSDIEFISLIAFLMALVAFAINMLLPAFIPIGKSIQLSDPNDTHLLVTLLYFGLAIGQLFFGTLSDSLGRKKAIFFGLALFIIGCFVSFISKSMTILILGQIIQGIGLGAPRVVTMAVVRDNYDGNQMGRIMSFIMVVFILVPTVSPYLGQLVISLTNWRVLFIIFMLLGGIALLWMKIRLPESLRIENRTSFSTRKLAKSVRLILTNKISMGYTLTLGFFSSAFIAYLNMSQQIFEVKYGLGQNYPLFFALLSISIGAASFLSGKLVIKLGMQRLVKIALIINLIVSLPLFLLLIFDNIELPFGLLFTYLMIVLFCFGILVGNLNSLAMKPLGKTAGVGAAIVGALSTLISIPLAILINSNYDGTLLPLISGFFIMGLIASLIFFLTRKIDPSN